MIQILFICMGNICRSPTAEGVFRKHVIDAGLKESYRGDIFIDSAGTTGFHTGHPPDPRSEQIANANGVSLEGITSRQVTVNDFEDFDYILAMDDENVKNLKKMGPKELHHKIHLFMEYAEDCPGLDEVPDPYYGEDGGFEHVFDIVNRASIGFLKHLQNNKEV